MRTAQMLICCAAVGCVAVFTSLADALPKLSVSRTNAALKLGGGRSEQGVEPGSCGRWQSTIDLGTEPVVISMECSANNALDAIGSWWLDGQITTALFHRASQVNRVAIIGNGVITEPFRQDLTIYNSRLAEAKQGADLGAMALDGAARDCWRLGCCQSSAQPHDTAADSQLGAVVAPATTAKIEQNDNTTI